MIDALAQRGRDVAETYGVLENLDRAREFVKAVSEKAALRVVYIVTDDERRFQMICADLPSDVLPLQQVDVYADSYIAQQLSRIPGVGRWDCSVRSQTLNPLTCLQMSIRRRSPPMPARMSVRTRFQRKYPGPAGCLHKWQKGMFCLS